MSLTPEQMAQTPASKPPPGVVPNFVDPPSGAPVLIAVGTVLLAIMLVFACIRFYVKAFVRRNVTADDCKWWFTRRLFGSVCHHENFADRRLQIRDHTGRRC